ncbi:MAG: hypothetical protein FWG69_02995 [Oscillospiraceae bacterium]|nr:hypothetical protein [Oscillospiraceae bacterium]
MEVAIEMAIPKILSQHHHIDNARLSRNTDGCVKFASSKIYPCDIF